MVALHLEGPVGRVNGGRGRPAGGELNPWDPVSRTATAPRSLRPPFRALGRIRTGTPVLTKDVSPNRRDREGVRPSRLGRCGRTGAAFRSCGARATVRARRHRYLDACGACRAGSPSIDDAVSVTSLGTPPRRYGWGCRMRLSRAAFRLLD